MKTIHRVVILGLLTVCQAAIADELHMKNGSRLIGTLVRSEAGQVIFDMPFAPNAKIKSANIERIITDKPVTLMMTDGAIYHERTINSTEAQLIAKSPDQDPVVFATDDISLINPEPWKLGEGHRWTGSFSAALESERGNSDTDEWDIDGTTELRSLRNRYTFAGDMELEEASGVKTSDNWKAGFKYDRFRSRESSNYFGASVRFEYDRFTDLDLRTTIGPHIGRKFLDTRHLSLQGEIGPVWVDEKFDIAEDNDFPGALWAFRADTDFFGFGTTAFLIHDGTLNFDDPDDLILNTTIGIKLPLIFGLETGFQAEYEYDGGAVENVDTLDETYNFRIGYTW